MIATAAAGLLSSNTAHADLSQVSFSSTNIPRAFQPAISISNVQSEVIYSQPTRSQTETVSRWAPIEQNIPKYIASIRAENGLHSERVIRELKILAETIKEGNDRKIELQYEKYNKVLKGYEEANKEIKFVIAEVLLGIGLGVGLLRPAPFRAKVKTLVERKVGMTTREREFLLETLESGRGIFGTFKRGMEVLSYLAASGDCENEKKLLYNHRFYRAIVVGVGGFTISSAGVLTGVEQIGNVGFYAGTAVLIFLLAKACFEFTKYDSTKYTGRAMVERYKKWNRARNS